MNNKVSVIIPFYGVEDYVEECLNSVINQTYKNLEIICIDDCSLDNSLKIVENFAKKDDRIKIVKHIKNKGLSGARNTGLKEATGEYIYFIDSDDFIDLDYIEKMVKTIEKYNVNVVCNKNIKKFLFIKNKRIFFHKNRKIKNGLLKINNDNIYKIPIMSWSKLYKKSFLDKIKANFPVGFRYEDNYFDATTLIYTDKIFILDHSSYYYRQRNNSIMNSLNKIKNFDIIKIFEKIYYFYKKNNLLNNNKINILAFKFHLRNHQEKAKMFNLIKIFFNEIKKDILDNKKIYNKKDLLFLNCILNSKSYFIFKIKYLFKKFF